MALPLSPTVSPNRRRCTVQRSLDNDEMLLKCFVPSAESAPPPSNATAATRAECLDEGRTTRTLKEAVLADGVVAAACAAANPSLPESASASAIPCLFLTPEAVTAHNLTISADEAAALSLEKPAVAIAARFSLPLSPITCRERKHKEEKGFTAEDTERNCYCCSRDRKLSAKTCTHSSSAWKFCFHERTLNVCDPNKERKSKQPVASLRGRGAEAVLLLDHDCERESSFTSFVESPVARQSEGQAGLQEADCDVTLLADDSQRGVIADCASVAASTHEHCSARGVKQTPAAVPSTTLFPAHCSPEKINNSSCAAGIKNKVLGNICGAGLSESEPGTSSCSNLMRPNSKPNVFSAQAEQLPRAAGAAAATSAIAASVDRNGTAASARVASSTATIAQEKNVFRLEASAYLAAAFVDLSAQFHLHGNQALRLGHEELLALQQQQQLPYLQQHAPQKQKERKRGKRQQKEEPKHEQDVQREQLLSLHQQQKQQCCTRLCSERPQEQCVSILLCKKEQKQLEERERWSGSDRHDRRKSKHGHQRLSRRSSRSEQKARHPRVAEQMFLSREAVKKRFNKGTHKALQRRDSASASYAYYGSGSFFVKKKHLLPKVRRSREDRRESQERDASNFLRLTFGTKSVPALPSVSSTDSAADAVCQTLSEASHATAAGAAWCSSDCSSFSLAKACTTSSATPELAALPAATTTSFIGGSTARLRPHGAVRNATEPGWRHPFTREGQRTNTQRLRKSCSSSSIRISKQTAVDRSPAAGTATVEFSASASKTSTDHEEDCRFFQREDEIASQLLERFHQQTQGHHFQTQQQQPVVAKDIEVDSSYECVPACQVSCKNFATECMHSSLAATTAGSKTRAAAAAVFRKKRGTDAAHALETICDGNQAATAEFIGTMATAAEPDKTATPAAEAIAAAGNAPYFEEGHRAVTGTAPTAMAARTKAIDAVAAEAASGGAAAMAKNAFGEAQMERLIEADSEQTSQITPPGEVVAAGAARKDERKTARLFAAESGVRGAAAVGAIPVTAPSPLASAADITVTSSPTPSTTVTAAAAATIASIRPPATARIVGQKNTSALHPAADTIPAANTTTTTTTTTTTRNTISTTTATSTTATDMKEAGVSKRTLSAGLLADATVVAPGLTDLSTVSDGSRTGEATASKISPAENQPKQLQQLPQQCMDFFPQLSSESQDSQSGHPEKQQQQQRLFAEKRQSLAETTPDAFSLNFSTAYASGAGVGAKRAWLLRSVNALRRWQRSSDSKVSSSSTATTIVMNDEDNKKSECPSALTITNDSSINAAVAFTQAVRPPEEAAPPATAKTLAVGLTASAAARSVAPVKKTPLRIESKKKSKSAFPSPDAGDNLLLSHCHNATTPVNASSSSSSSSSSFSVEAFSVTGAAAFLNGTPSTTVVFPPPPTATVGGDGADAVKNSVDFEASTTPKLPASTSTSTAAAAAAASCADSSLLPPANSPLSISARGSPTAAASASPSLTLDSAALTLTTAPKLPTAASSFSTAAAAVQSTTSTLNTMRPVVNNNSSSISQGEQQMQLVPKLQALPTFTPTAAADSSIKTAAAAPASPPPQVNSSCKITRKISSCSSSSSNSSSFCSSSSNTTSVNVGESRGGVFPVVFKGTAHGETRQQQPRSEVWCVRTLETGDKAALWDVAISPAGDWLAAAGQAGVISLWKIPSPTFRPRASSPAPTPATGGGPASCGSTTTAGRSAVVASLASTTTEKLGCWPYQKRTVDPARLDCRPSVVAESCDSQKDSASVKVSRGAASPFSTLYDGCVVASSVTSSSTVLSSSAELASKPSPEKTSASPLLKTAAPPPSSPSPSPSSLPSLPLPPLSPSPPPDVWKAAPPPLLPDSFVTQKSAAPSLPRLPPPPPQLLPCEALSPPPSQPLAVTAPPPLAATPSPLLPLLPPAASPPPLNPAVVAAASPLSPSSPPSSPPPPEDTSVIPPSAAPKALNSCCIDSCGGSEEKSRNFFCDFVVKEQKRSADCCCWFSKTAPNRLRSTCCCCKLKKNNNDCLLLCTAHKTHLQQILPRQTPNLFSSGEKKPCSENTSEVDKLLELRKPLAAAPETTTLKNTMSLPSTSLFVDTRMKLTATGQIKSRESGVHTPPPQDFSPTTEALLLNNNNNNSAAVLAAQVHTTVKDHLLLLQQQPIMNTTTSQTTLLTPTEKQAPPPSPTPSQHAFSCTEATPQLDISHQAPIQYNHHHHHHRHPTPYYYYYCYSEDSNPSHSAFSTTTHSHNDFNAAANLCNYSQQCPVVKNKETSSYAKASRHRLYSEKEEEKAAVAAPATELAGAVITTAAQNQTTTPALPTEAVAGSEAEKALYLHAETACSMYGSKATTNSICKKSAAAVRLWQQQQPPHPTDASEEIRTAEKAEKYKAGDSVVVFNACNNKALQVSQRCGRCSPQQPSRSSSVAAFKASEIDENTGGFAGGGEVAAIRAVSGAGEEAAYEIETTEEEEQAAFSCETCRALFSSDAKTIAASCLATPHFLSHKKKHSTEEQLPPCWVCAQTTPSSATQQQPLQQVLSTHHHSQQQLHASVLHQQPPPQTNFILLHSKSQQLQPQQLQPQKLHPQSEQGFCEFKQKPKQRQQQAGFEWLVSERPTLCLTGHNAAIVQLMWAPTKTQKLLLLLSASLDKTVRVWRPRYCKREVPVEQEISPVAILRCSDWPTSAAFHPIFRDVIYLGCLDATVQVWRLFAKCGELQHPKRAEHSFQNSKTPSVVLDKQEEVHQRQKQKTRNRPQTCKEKMNASAQTYDAFVVDQLKVTELVTAISLSPNGAVLAVGFRNGSIAFYDAITLKFCYEIDCKNRKGKFSKGRKVTSLEWRSDGMALCVTTNDSRVRIFTVPDLTCVAKFKGHLNEQIMLRANYADDGRGVVCGSENGWICYWDAEENPAIATEAPATSAGNNGTYYTAAHLRHLRGKMSPLPLKKNTNANFVSFRAFTELLTCSLVAPPAFSLRVASRLSVASLSFPTHCKQQFAHNVYLKRLRLPFSTNRQGKRRQSPLLHASINSVTLPLSETGSSEFLGFSDSLLPLSKSLPSPAHERGKNALSTFFCSAPDCSADNNNSNSSNNQYNGADSAAAAAKSADTEADAAAEDSPPSAALGATETAAKVATQGQRWPCVSGSNGMRAMRLVQSRFSKSTKFSEEQQQRGFLAAAFSAAAQQPQLQQQQLSAPATAAGQTGQPVSVAAGSAAVRLAAVASRLKDSLLLPQRAVQLYQRKQLRQCAFTGPSSSCNDANTASFLPSPDSAAVVRGSSCSCWAAEEGKCLLSANSQLCSDSTLKDSEFNGAWAGTAAAAEKKKHHVSFACSFNSNAEHCGCRITASEPLDRHAIGYKGAEEEEGSRHWLLGDDLCVAVQPSVYAECAKQKWHLSPPLTIIAGSQHGKLRIFVNVGRNLKKH